ARTRFPGPAGPVLRRPGGAGRGPPVPGERHPGSWCAARAARRRRGALPALRRGVADQRPQPGADRRPARAHRPAGVLRQPQLAPRGGGHRRGDGARRRAPRAGLRHQRLRRLLGVPAVPRGHRPRPQGGRGRGAGAGEAAPFLRPPRVRRRERRRRARRPRPGRSGGAAGVHRALGAHLGRRDRGPAAGGRAPLLPAGHRGGPARRRRPGRGDPRRGLAVPVGPAAGAVARARRRRPRRRTARRGRARRGDRADRVRVRPRRGDLGPRHRGPRAGRGAGHGLRPRRHRRPGPAVRRHGGRADRRAHRRRRPARAGRGAAGRLRGQRRVVRAAVLRAAPPPVAL
ncbi:MAG: Coproporphyrin ferrochelatase, partial [uncultured Pseudonocardia sp.]